jgi:UPF0716 protein FxsA
MIRLLLVMTLIPAIEMLLLLELAERLGAVETVVLILLTGSLGASLAKREGLGVLRQLQEDAARGIPPADRLVEGVLVLIGGVLLITPGVLTDALGVALLIGPVRRPAARALKRALAQRFQVGGGGVFVGAPGWGQGVPQEAVPPSGPAAPPRARGGFDHPVR